MAGTGSGRNDQYIPVLELVRDRLAPDALVIADLGKEDPDLEAYQRYVRDAAHGFDSMSLPLDAGIEVSIWRPWAEIDDGRAGNRA